MRQSLIDFWYILCNLKSFLYLTFDFRLKVYKVPATVIREYKLKRWKKHENIPLIRKMYLQTERMAHIAKYPRLQWPENWGHSGGKNVVPLPPTESSDNKL